jgi:ComEC/Rec2-related protein
MKRLWCYVFRRVDLQLGFCVALLAGIGAAHGGFRLPTLVLLSASIVVLMTLRKRNLMLFFAVLLLGFGVGCSRGTVYMQKLSDYQNLRDQKVTLTMLAETDGAYGTNSQLSFTAAHVILPSGERLAGTFYVSGFGLNAVFQGDELQVTGKLRSGTGQYQAFMSYTQLVLIRHHQSAVAQLRRRFAAGMQTALPEPQASFAMGLLIGQRTTLPAEVKQDMLMVGLTHIIAVSGYNLTIMLHAARRLLGGHSKRLSTLLSLGLIVVFLLLTGASASIVRAAIVSVLSIWASYYGRTFRPLNLIFIAAAITAWANPFYVWSNVSWYLSFLAFYGVLVVAPIIASRARHSWQRSLVAAVALESICAELMTAPFVVHTFGQLSLIGLPANVLVAVLIPLAMLLSLIAGIAGMLASLFAGWFAWPAGILLTYMLDTAHVLAGIPHTFLEHIGLSLWQMILLYAIVPLLTFVLLHKTSRARYAKITDKNQEPDGGINLERTQQMVNNQA